MSTVVISRRGAERIRANHPWVYRSDVLSSDARAGDLVRVTTERDRPLGWAFWSDASQISLRMFSSSPEPHFDERALFQDRLRQAVDYRASLAIDGTACRLVHGEADRLPALIVDRYADWLVLQTLSQGMDRRLAVIVELLVEIVRPRGVLARNDPKVRRLEGLEEKVDVVFGEVPAVVDVREGRIQHRVDLRHGQKTGLFLDQQENHAAAARYARGRALDGFSYLGGFALQLASACDSVLALDSSAPAVAAIRENAARNQVTNLEAREANVFDELRELGVSGERFHTIVLDPPAFARNRAAVERAVAGYKEINLRALKLLEPDGHLVTCSCSYNVDEALFEAILEDAAADARAVVALVEKRMQARDHPVLVGVPETHYLKCLILRKLA
ncbi:MAG TPA: class I SAM-dependent rRNA methyltransferase [Vicinamibacterales bacterium]|nr:class I SAM-dependent rRNA methyltransferase [Vicinamibacterales bacterium]